jgi:hypothetical protein
MASFQACHARAGNPFRCRRAYIKSHLTVPEESRRQRRKRGRRGMNFSKNFEKKA